MRSRRPTFPNSSWASATSTMSTRSQTDAKRCGKNVPATVRVRRRARMEISSGSPGRTARRAARRCGRSTPGPVKSVFTDRLSGDATPFGSMSRTWASTSRSTPNTRTASPRAGSSAISSITGTTIASPVSGRMRPRRSSGTPAGAVISRRVRPAIWSMPSRSDATAARLAATVATSAAIPAATPMTVVTNRSGRRRTGRRKKVRSSTATAPLPLRSRRRTSGPRGPRRRQLHRHGWRAAARSPPRGAARP